ncbi:glycoside hydrolase family 2 protein [Ruegeria sp. 2205SS24-7]|uniref:beta-mannosidase n=1 Tax=Ruegeria discodermiae TaxID=3064389 RepID=UPI002741D492|nr:glycoside hydrolase family 2 protein [Ruegeria sp. 2205SS24-7]MDP5217330.1 glycoside hydrolase family 2 protein [Ruegeria sp. 2205SS24-7]
MHDAEGVHDLMINLPGDGITALHNAGAIPEPYFGRNEYELRWIAERDWVFERRFQLENSAFYLHLSEVDTVAEITLNGMPVSQSENVFRSHRVDVSDAARSGENTLQITIRSSVNEGAARQAALPYPVPSHPRNCPIPNGNMLRKVQCDFGWDWNIALAPFGIYGEMRLVPKDAPSFSRLRTTQHHAEGHVTLTVRAQLDGADKADVTLAGETQSVSSDASGGITADFVINSPELWWPRGLGAQTLHELTLTSGPTSETRKVGLRNIELITEPDEIGTSFKLRVNGVDVFCRGANWIPADALPGRITPEKTRDLLQSAVDANMNMLRIWGGGRYEPDSFYEACDELGLMIWQDAMFSCNLYPAHDAFLNDVHNELCEQAARLSTHACLALWCGDNELVGALGWYEESVKDRDRYLVAYDRLNRTIERAINDTLGEDVNWWPSSPSLGPLNFGDGWHDDQAGDMHFWSVWHERRDFDHYRDVAPRFCSEFGFQSYPSMDVIRSFATERDFNIAAPVLESHQKNAGGNARIAETMFRYFRFPEGFENFVYLSQIQQGLAIKTAVSHWRAQKPRCMGTLYWQLNDTWPVASWSSLDYGGGWKLLHHMARRFYAPVAVTVVPTRDGYNLVAVNDTATPVTVSLSVAALRLNGSERPVGKARCGVATDAAATLLQIPKTALAADEILLYRMTLPDGSVQTDHYAPLPYKSYDLLQTGLRLTTQRAGDQIELTLSADRPALYAGIEADQPGRFSDNALLVLPGAPRHLTFTPSISGADPQFTLRDLHSATYGETSKG